MMIQEVVYLKTPVLSILHLALLGIAYLVYRIAKYRYQQVEKTVKKDIQDFKSKSNRIQIDYTDLEIYSNSWLQEVEVGSGTNSRNEHVQINANTIKLKKQINNIPFNIEIDINMETDILKMKLAIKHKIDLYYNPYDPNENYLDLDFLETTTPDN